MAVVVLGALIPASAAACLQGTETCDRRRSQRVS
jgi:hypothetical protein